MNLHVDIYNLRKSSGFNWGKTAIGELANAANYLKLQFLMYGMASNIVR